MNLECQAPSLETAKRWRFKVNTPPPERRWLRITAESRIGPPSADSGHTKVVIWLGLSLRFDVFHPDFIGHVATACNPIAPCPQVLAPVAFAQAHTSPASVNLMAF